MYADSRSVDEQSGASMRSVNPQPHDTVGPGTRYADRPSVPGRAGIIMPQVAGGLAESLRLPRSRHGDGVRESAACRIPATLLRPRSADRAGTATVRRDRERAGSAPQVEPAARVRLLDRCPIGCAPLSSLLIVDCTDSLRMLFERKKYAAFLLAGNSGSGPTHKPSLLPLPYV